MTTDNSLDLNQYKEIINSVDLSPIVNRLVKIEKWSEKQALAAVEQYRIYIFLCKKHGNHIKLPPSKDIDEVWHAHILHTKLYADFCHKIFNQFMHHDPADTESDNATDYANDFENNTQRLYYDETGDYIYAIRPIPIKVKLAMFFKSFKDAWIKKALRAEEIASV